MGSLMVPIPTLGTNHRQADLTSMRVARELEVYWIICSDVRKIRFVGEQDGCLRWRYHP